MSIESVSDVLFSTSAPPKVFTCACRKSWHIFLLSFCYLGKKRKIILFFFLTVSTKLIPNIVSLGLPRLHSSKGSACQCKRHRRLGFHPWVRKIPGGGNGNRLQYSCLKKAHGQRSHGFAELDMTEPLRLSFLCMIKMFMNQLYPNTKRKKFFT